MIFHKNPAKEKKDFRTVEARARNAKELLANPFFEYVLKDIEKKTILSWKTTPARDIEARESLFLCIKVIEKIRQFLDGYINEAIYEAKRNKSS